MVNLPAVKDKTQVADEYIAAQETDLLARIPGVMRDRKEAGLEGLIGGLDSVIINTEPDHLGPAVEELLCYTGLGVSAHFEDPGFETYVLTAPGSASFLIRSRRGADNPFLALNSAVKSASMPHTRLETFIFTTHDLERYVGIQKQRGIRFLTNGIIRTDNFDFIQTLPSPYTGNSVGFIQWMGQKGSYATGRSEHIPSVIRKPDLPFLSSIGRLDHAATRVRAAERNDAIIEFLNLTNYHFDFAVYVRSLNSITSVARQNKNDFAMVFTSGISPYQDDLTSGPTELFIRNYGTRVHHIAFSTDQIESTFLSLKEHGMKFLIELVGSPDEGLRQTFSNPSVHTMLVNEYIHRYEGFDGFFTRSNVELLTKATQKQ